MIIRLLFTWKHAVSSNPPTAYIAPSSEPTAMPRRRVSIDATECHIFVDGSKHSAESKWFVPSWPPIAYLYTTVNVCDNKKYTYNFPCALTTPTCRRRMFISVTVNHRSRLQSYASTERNGSPVVPQNRHIYIYIYSLYDSKYTNLCHQHKK